MKCRAKSDDGEAGPAKARGRGSRGGRGGRGGRGKKGTSAGWWQAAPGPLQACTVDCRNVVPWATPDARNA